MKYTTLGSTGLRVSEIGIGSALFGNTQEGTGTITKEVAHEILSYAEKNGINYIDTADVYGRPRTGRSEKIIGEWLRQRNRDDFVIASKVGDPFGDGPNQSGLNRKHIRKQISGTLDRLGTSYLDVYYIHSWDERTPIEETLRTLTDLVHKGLVHYIGGSRMTGRELTESLWVSESNGLERFEITQPRFNAVHREEVKEYLNACESHGLAVCPFGALEGGFLTGKYVRDQPMPGDSRGDNRSWGDKFDDRQWEVLDSIKEIATELDCTPTQVALRWLIDQERFTCVPIVGARSEDQLRENLGAIDVRITADQTERINEAYYSTSQG